MGELKIISTVSDGSLAEWRVTYASYPDVIAILDAHDAWRESSNNWQTLYQSECAETERLRDNADQGWRLRDAAQNLIDELLATIARVDEVRRILGEA